MRNVLLGALVPLIAVAAFTSMQPTGLVLGAAALWLWLDPRQLARRCTDRNTEFEFLRGGDDA